MECERTSREKYDKRLQQKWELSHISAQTVLHFHTAPQVGTYLPSFITALQTRFERELCEPLMTLLAARLETSVQKIRSLRMIAHVYLCLQITLSQR